MPRFVVSEEHHGLLQHNTFHISSCVVEGKTLGWYRKPMRGFNLVPIRSDPMLIFLSGNRP